MQPNLLILKSSICFPFWRRTGQERETERPRTTTHTSALTVTGQPIVTTFIETVLLSHGEHTAAPFLSHPSYIYVSIILYKLIGGEQVEKKGTGSS